MCDSSRCAGQGNTRVTRGWCTCACAAHRLLEWCRLDGRRGGGGAEHCCSVVGGRGDGEVTAGGSRSVPGQQRWQRLAVPSPLTRAAGGRGGAAPLRQTGAPGSAGSSCTAACEPGPTLRSSSSSSSSKGGGRLGGRGEWVEGRECGWAGMQCPPPPLPAHTKLRLLPPTRSAVTVQHGEIHVASLGGLAAGGKGGCWLAGWCGHESGGGGGRGDRGCTAQPAALHAPPTPPHPHTLTHTLTPPPPPPHTHARAHRLQRSRSYSDPASSALKLRCADAGRSWGTAICAQEGGGGVEAG